MSPNNSSMPSSQSGVPAVTITNMMEILAQFQPQTMQARAGQETVIRMQHRWKPYVSVVVYTTVVGGDARGAGEDAIRLFIRHENSGRLLMGFPRIYRNGSWARALFERVRHAFHLVSTDHIPRCYVCETLMILLSPRGKQGPLMWVCPERDGPFLPCRIPDVRPGVPQANLSRS